jgi:hypothetical protein
MKTCSSSEILWRLSTIIRTQEVQIDIKINFRCCVTQVTLGLIQRQHRLRCTLQTKEDAGTSMVLEARLEDTLLQNSSQT